MFLLFDALNNPIISFIRFGFTFTGRMNAAVYWMRLHKRYLTLWGSRPRSLQTLPHPSSHPDKTPGIETAPHASAVRTAEEGKA